MNASSFALLHLFSRIGVNVEKIINLTSIDDTKKGRQQ